MCCSHRIWAWNSTQQVTFFSSSIMFLVGPYAVFSHTIWRLLCWWSCHTNAYLATDVISVYLSMNLWVIFSALHTHTQDHEQRIIRDREKRTVSNQMNNNLQSFLMPRKTGLSWLLDWLTQKPWGLHHNRIITFYQGIPHFTRQFVVCIT